MSPPGLPERSTPPIDIARRSLLRGGVLRAPLQRVEPGLERIERPRIDVRCVGIEKEVEAGVLTVDGPGDALFGQDFVQRRAKLRRRCGSRARTRPRRRPVSRHATPVAAHNGIRVVGALVADLLEPLRFRRLEVQPFQDRDRSRHRPAGKAAPPRILAKVARSGMIP